MTMTDEYGEIILTLGTYFAKLALYLVADGVERRQSQVSSFYTVEVPASS